MLKYRNKETKEPTDLFINEEGCLMIYCKPKTEGRMTFGGSVPYPNPLFGGFNFQTGKSRSEEEFEVYRNEILEKFKNEYEEIIETTDAKNIVANQIIMELGK